MHSGDCLGGHLLENGFCKMADARVSRDLSRAAQRSSRTTSPVTYP